MMQHFVVFHFINVQQRKEKRKNQWSKNDSNKTKDAYSPENRQKSQQLVGICSSTY